MTVDELIAVLQRCDPTLPVRIVYDSFYGGGELSQDNIAVVSNNSANEDFLAAVYLCTNSADLDWRLGERPENYPKDGDLMPGYRP